ncbi:MAG TPA: hypothetical protein VN610_03560 [Bryobacteraceae bacterium]|nr:hypothetical protein [Bryobacteraceae bacterium]
MGKAPEHVAIVQPWQPDYQTDADASYNDDFFVMVAKRPIVQVMHFADYHHLKAGMRRTLFEIQAMSSGDQGSTRKRRYDSAGARPVLTVNFASSPVHLNPSIF